MKVQEHVLTVLASVDAHMQRVCNKYSLDISAYPVCISSLESLLANDVISSEDKHFLQGDIGQLQGLHDYLVL